MRAAKWYNNQDVRVEEMPMPQIGPGELLLKIEASGICGSDVMEWYRINRAPLVLGHEIGGKIIGVGKGVTRYKEGDRISAAHHVPCNTCPHCLSGNHTVCNTLRQTNFDPGGFAQYIRLPAINVDRGVFRLPENMSYEEATFIEPLACILRGQRRANVQSGQCIAVIGSGIAGQLHIRLARAMGARLIIATDISEYRLEAALKSGADYALQASAGLVERIRQINDGRLADAVIICTGAASAIDQGLRAVERGGSILFFAPTGPDITIPISINDIFWRNDITLTTSYAGSPADYLKALQLIQSGTVPVQSLITHRLSLNETGLGFKLVAQAQNSIKVIIEPQK
jgi:L-iditol 2-dehydrogenase